FGSATAGHSSLDATEAEREAVGVAPTREVQRGAITRNRGRGVERADACRKRASAASDDGVAGDERGGLGPRGVDDVDSVRRGRRSRGAAVDQIVVDDGADAPLDGDGGAGRVVVSVDGEAVYAR